MNYDDREDEHFATTLLGYEDLLIFSVSFEYFSTTLVQLST